MLWTAPPPAPECHESGLLTFPRFGGGNYASSDDDRSRHRQIGVSGHGIDQEGQVIIRRQLKRRYVVTFFEKLPPCLVGIEACAASHHWSRQLQALGHTVRLMGALDRDLIRVGHYGRRSCEPRKAGRTHGCTPPVLRREDFPCQHIAQLGIAADWALRPLPTSKRKSMGDLSPLVHFHHARRGQAPCKLRREMPAR